MIISHKYKFIFIKARKTAGSSTEVYLSDFLGESDIYAPRGIGERYGERFNPWWGVIECLCNPVLKSRTAMGKRVDILHTGKTIKIMRDWWHKAKFYPHIPAFFVKNRIPKNVWDNYYKFCFERNPWDKVISHFYHCKYNQQTIGKNLTFSDFMEKGLYKRIFNFPLYMDVKQEKAIVDKVLYFEDLNSELTETLNWLGIPFSNLTENIHGNFRTDRRPYREFFSGENGGYVDVIGKEFRKEIDLHGYDF